MATSAYNTTRRSRWGVPLAAAILVGAAVTVWLYHRQARNNPMTDDAILIANTVNVASTVPGRIIAINVKENDRVRRGDLLFAIDPATYQIAVDQALADLKLAEAARDTQRRTIAAEQNNAHVADAQRVRAKTNLDLAEQTLTRLNALLPKGYVTRQQVDDARTTRDDAQVTLAQAHQQADAANVRVDTLDAADATVQARQAALALAKHNLANTEIRALHDGRIVGRTSATGQIVAPGQSLFTLIDTENWYVSASFSETELDRIKVGDCAKVYAQTDRSTPIRGRVEGIGWGVSSEELVNLPRALPYVPKTLNWVRLSQRFPVRVKLIDPPENLTRMGASAIVIVRHGESC